MKEPAILAESGALTSAARLSAMLAHPTLAVAVTERGRIRRCNTAWSTLFALPSDVSVESHLISLFPNANSADRFEQALRSAVDSNPAFVRVEYMLVRRDGVPFMAEVIVHSVGGEAGQPSGLSTDAVWQVRDITAERELRRELRDLEAYYRALSTYQWDLTFVIDRRDCISFASPSVETALGWRANALLGEPFSTLLATSGAVGAMQWLRGGRAEKHASLSGYRLRVRHQNGETRVLECRLRNCVDMPRISGLVVNARDVTDRVDEEERELESRKRALALRDRLFEIATAIAGFFEDRVTLLLRAACDDIGASSADFWVLDDRPEQLRCTQGYAAIRDGDASGVDRTGMTFDLGRFERYARELRSLRPLVIDDIRRHDAVDDEHRQSLIAAGLGAILEFPIAQDGALVGVLSIAQANGPRLWRTEEIDFAGGISLLIAGSLAVHERENVVGQAEQMANLDRLTSVLNRSSGEFELACRVEQARSNDETLVVALLDIDLFKEINDGYGHAQADALLAAIAQLLVEMTGPGALVARMGGDEFLITCSETVVGDADTLLQRVIDRLASEPLVPTIEQRIGASVGVARFPFDGDESEALLSAAESALFEAKSRGRQQVFAFNHWLSEKISLQRDLDVEINDALGRNEFCMFYQPQVSFSTGQVVGMEALLRWQHPTRGLLLPETFIGAALHRGMIDTITKWVVTQVCEQIVAWRKAGRTVEIPVSVNVTGRQFHDRRLPAIVASALMKSALPARMLMLEVTEESLAGNHDGTERVVRELAKLGVRVSIADFKFDDASLGWLSRIDVAQLKIDKRFVQGIPDDAISSVLIDAVVALGNRLDYQVVAEGVETRAQFDRLVAIGCSAGQGFHFGAPLSALELQDFLGARQDARVH